MNKKLWTLFITFFALFLTVIILTFPSQCLLLACNGLNLWFQKMIPALFPFMVLSGIMIRMNLTDAFVKLAKPVLHPLFRLNSHCIYAIVIGFLCGFPMGAHVISQLYERHMLSKKESSFLLAFCNNIGPVYFVSFVLPTIGIKAAGPALFGMYGIPLLYGLLLRYTCYKNDLDSCNSSKKHAAPPVSFLFALDESVISALNGITKLGGYMIVFNLLNILPILIFAKSSILSFISCFLEITGGIQLIGKSNPFFVLCILPFGGLSCIAQTFGMIKNTDLSLQEYVTHKVILTLISVFYYSVCFFLT